MAHGSMSKTLVLLLAASIPVGYVIWLSKHRAAPKTAPSPSQSSQAVESAAT